MIRTQKETAGKQVNSSNRWCWSCSYHQHVPVVCVIGLFLLIALLVVQSTSARVQVIDPTKGNHLVQILEDSWEEYYKSISNSTSILAQERLNSSTLIYTKVRLDKHFLPMNKNFQKSKPYEEKKLYIFENGTNSLIIFDDLTKNSKLNGSENFAQLKKLTGVGGHDTNATQIKLQTAYVSETINLANLTQDDMIFEALNQIYRSRLIQFSLMNYDRLEDRKRSSDASLVSSEKCKRDLDFLLTKLELIEEAKKGIREPLTGISPELATFFDAYANRERGLLLGNYNWLGNWRQCHVRHIIEVQTNRTSDHIHLAQPAQVTSFTGRYCVASIRNPAWEQKIDAKLAQMKKELYLKYPAQERDYRHYFRIQLGICLPQSCDSNIIDTRPADIRRLAMHRLNEPFQSQYNLVDLFCLPDEGSELRQLDTSGKLFVLLSCFWLSLLAWATYVDYYKLVDLSALRSGEHGGVRKSGLQKLVISLSLVESVATLFKVSRVPAQALGSQQSAQLTTAQAGTKVTQQAASVLEKQPLVVHAQQQQQLQVESAHAQTRNAQSALKQQHQQQQSAMVAASATANKGLDATAAQVAPPRANDLRFLDFIKVILMPIIVFGHIGMMMLMVAQYPLNFNTEIDFGFHLQSGTTFYVDWYFSITGFLIAYAMFASRSVHKNSPAVWLYTIFHRYWRLAPIYVLTFWFCRSLFPLTGFGPIWDYGTSNITGRALCQRESWWVPITLTSNFLTLHDECVMPSWYISNDMQFYLVTPLILVLLAKSSSLGWMLCGGMMSGSTMGLMYQYISFPRANHLELLRPRADVVMRNNWDMHHTYLQPQYRISSYLIGILAGHYTYMVRSGKWNSIFYYLPTSGGSGSTTRKRAAGRARLLLALIGIQLALTINFATWVCDILPKWLEPHAKYAAVFIYSTSHTLAAVGPTLFFVAIVLGQWPSLRRMMENNVWIYLSRINYFIYLAQVEFVVWLLTASDQMPDLSTQGQLSLLFICLPPLYFAALLVTLFVGNPLARLETEFVGGLLTGGHGGGGGGGARRPPPAPIADQAEKGASGAGGGNHSAQASLELRSRGGGGEPVGGAGKFDHSASLQVQEVVRSSTSNKPGSRSLQLLLENQQQQQQLARSN